MAGVGCYLPLGLVGRMIDGASSSEEDYREVMS